MNIRRKVVLPKLMDFLKFEFKYYDLKNNFYFNSQVFNHFTFFCVFVFCCGVFGIFKPIFWVFGLSSVALVIFLYLKTLKLCEGVSVQRKIKKNGREKDSFEIQYLIANETSFGLEDFSFIEKFEGVQTGHFMVSAGRTIPPHTQIHLTQKVLLDAGMGPKKFAAIGIHLTDDLGIFQFGINFFNADEIEVYPYIEEVPPLKAAISPETIDYGFYEIAKRGDSNLFIGTREYRHGDPIKHINWKLTKKTNKVIVNEYEKNTNTYVTLLMDLDLTNQMGFGELSTWEAAKDLALSIATNEVRKNNLIQIVSNNLFIPFGSGKNQLNMIERHFTFHEMVETKELNHLKHLQNLPTNGQVYYICPLIMTPVIRESFEQLIKMKILGQNIVIFALDPFEELARSIKGDMRSSIREMDRHARAEYLVLEEQFKKMGIPLVYLKVKPDPKLFEQLVREAQQLIEVK